jgi:hypothetical protein
MTAFPMLLSKPRSLAFRLTGALLALGLLLSPSFAQVTAAERCRTRCDAASPDAPPPCCKSHPATVAQDAQQSGDHGNHGSDGQTKYCPGCNGRPLLVEPTSIQLTLDPALVCFLPSAPATLGSADVCFAIFHPPRV